MPNNRFLSLLMYVAVGMMSVLLAVYISSKFVRRSFSQDAPKSPEPALAQAPSEAATKIETPPVAKNNSVSAALPDDVPFLEPYVFDMREGRRNPFRPPISMDGATGLDALLPGTPLERYELDELKLVGIMWDVKSPKAMIIDPQGEVHVLGKDDRVGRKRGYIAKIREGEVVVVEATTFNGENTFSTRVLRIEK